jgi:HlyD family secretion protein
MVSKQRLTLGVALGLVVLAGGYHRLHGHPAMPKFITVPASVGDVVRRVAATGTLQAVTTVEVGSQVSGTISRLDADFNSIVRKGQVIATLDPSLVDAQVASARSAVAKADADRDAAAVAASDAGVKFKQAAALHDRHLLTDADFDTARVALETARANLDAAKSDVLEAGAALKQALVARQHTVITAPIDGIVVARNVDLGQTVAASYQAPTLFVIAADLTKMQLVADIDESDVGSIAPGEPVGFSVDAYPEEEFTGIVKRVRLQPTTEQNVVTYSAEVAVDNPDLRLKPGMTATLNVETARASGVLRVPVAGLRYVPREGVFKTLGLAVPTAVADERQHRPATSTGETGTVWIWDGNNVTALRVKIGLSDGSFAQVSGASLPAGAAVITGELTPSSGPISTPLLMGGH